MIVLIIYMVGYFLALYVSIRVVLKEGNTLTIRDLSICVLISLFSWTVAIAITVYLYGDVVIYKKKKTISDYYKIKT